MEINEKKFDKALHYIPVVIKHLQKIEKELIWLKQSMLMSIEEKKINKEGYYEVDTECNRVCNSK